MLLTLHMDDRFLRKYKQKTVECNGPQLSDCHLTA